VAHLVRSVRLARSVRRRPVAVSIALLIDSLVAEPFEHGLGRAALGHGQRHAVEATDLVLGGDRTSLPGIRGHVPGVRRGDDLDGDIIGVLEPK
jgi:hypothetical protein